MPEDEVTNTVEVNYIANYALFVYAVVTAALLSVLLSAQSFECVR